LPGGPFIRQEFIEAISWMVADAGDDIFEIGELEFEENWRILRFFDCGEMERENMCFF
jgi:hypothetical protein